MQIETVLFSKREYTLILSGGATHGDTFYKGDDILIRVAKDSTETSLFNLREYIDNESEPFPLTGLTTKFVATQRLTSVQLDEGIVKATIDKACTIINALNGEIQLELVPVDTVTEGTYECYIVIIDGAAERYNDFMFLLDIFDPTT